MRTFVFALAVAVALALPMVRALAVKPTPAFVGQTNAPTPTKPSARVLAGHLSPRQIHEERRAKRLSVDYSGRV